MNNKLPKLRPDIRIFGDINEDKLNDFLCRLDEVAEQEQSILFELTTLGGEADLGRRLAQEIKFFRKYVRKDIYFLGKTAVYSIGAVILSAFPKEHRFLAEGTMLMIHERRITKDVKFEGPMTAVLQKAQQLVSQFETGQYIEFQDYKDMAEGSNLTAETILEKAKSNWYLSAQEALDLGLIAGIV